MDSSKAFLLGMLIFGTIAATITVACNKHNEKMAEMGFCQSSVLGQSQVFWQKCSEVK